MTTEQPPSPSPKAAFLPDPPGMSAILRYISPEGGHDIIERALQYRPQASQSARDALNAAIDNSGIKLDGFRKPGSGARKLYSAPVASLSDPIHLEIVLDGNDRLAAAILEVWKEASPGLADIAVKLLEQENTPVLGPKREQFNELYPEESMEKAADFLCEEYPDVEFEFEYDDAVAMLAYLSGRYPYRHRSDSHLFSHVLEELEDLPADAIEWDEIPNFINQIEKLADEKSYDRIIAQDLIINTGIHTLAEFTAQLQFLEVTPPQTSDLPPVSNHLDEAALLLRELITALSRFAEVQPQAPTATEEQQRAEQRNLLGESVRSLIANWQALVERVANEPDPEPPEEPPAEPDSAELQRLEAANASLSADRDRLAQEKAGVEKENARLGKEFAERRQSYDRLRMEKDEQAAANSRLKRENRELREKLETLRLGLRQQIEGENPEIEIPDVPTAINVARQMYEPDRLLIALNSRSQEDTPYKRPREVFDALEWLANVYHDLRTNPPGADPEYDRRLKEACNGWFYSPKQSVTAKGKYPEEYETTANGKTYTLDPHIGEGTKGDPRNMVRIAFDWDADLQKVIVGYIGPHQQTDAT